nr:hypothetical protein [Tanacetum cinerariifolium]
MSPFPLVAKPKKGKSQTVTLTLPKSQGPEVPGTLSKKSKRPKSKNPPTETNVTSPKPMEGSEQAHSGTRKSQPLPIGKATYPKDSKGNIQPLDRDITSTTPNEGMAKTTPRPDGSLEDKDSGETIPPVDIEPIHTTVADPLGTGKTSSEVEPDNEPLQLQTFADIQAFLLSQDELDKERDKEEVLAAGEDMDEDSQVAEEVGTPPPKQDRPEPSHEKHKESAVSYADLKASIEQYYDENIPHRDQTDKLLLRDINNAVKDDPTTNKKTNEAIKIFTKITTQTTEILSLVKTIDFSTLRSVVTYLQAQALKQEEASAAWTNSSTNMAWNLSSIMIAIEISQTALKRPIINKGKGIETESDKDPSKKLVPASTTVLPDLDEEEKVPYTIHGKLNYLTHREIQAYLDKEEKMKKATEEAKILAMSKPEVIKVVREE